ncbi:MAG: hypothetical protein KDD64_04150 [Bdellovibrionales bacterium]|nr:hypothetical protein [Bdellovibrionales bacterium]
MKQIVLLFLCLSYSSFLLAEDVFHPKGSRGEFPNTNIDFYTDDHGGCDIDEIAESLAPLGLEDAIDNETAQGVLAGAGCEQPSAVGGQPPCKHNPDPPQPAPGGTYDDCIYRHSGPICSGDATPKQCCEFKKNESGEFTTQCECGGSFSPICNSQEDCARCLCSAEAGGEPPQCIKWILCIIKSDADGDFCKATLGFSKDAWRFSAARCVCDRGGDGKKWVRQPDGTWKKETGYNQNYCSCCDKRNAGEVPADGEAWQKCETAFQEINTTNYCDSVPYTHYGVGKCPCAEDRIIGEPVKCGNHYFCKCSNRPVRQGTKIADVEIKVEDKTVIDQGAGKQINYK